MGVKRNKVDYGYNKLEGLEKIRQLLSFYLEDGEEPFLVFAG